MDVFTLSWLIYLGAAAVCLASWWLATAFCRPGVIRLLLRIPLLVLALMPVQQGEGHWVPVLAAVGIDGLSGNLDLSANSVRVFLVGLVLSLLLVAMLLPRRRKV